MITKENSNKNRACKLRNIHRRLIFYIIILISYLRIANITIRAIRRRMMGMMIPTRKVVLSGSVVISADHLDSLNISLVVYALILNL